MQIEMVKTNMAAMLKVGAKSASQFLKFGKK